MKSVSHLQIDDSGQYKLISVGFGIQLIRKML